MVFSERLFSKPLILKDVEKSSFLLWQIKFYADLQYCIAKITENKKKKILEKLIFNDI